MNVLDNEGLYQDNFLHNHRKKIYITLSITFKYDHISSTVSQNTVPLRATQIIRLSNQGIRKGVRATYVSPNSRVVEVVQVLTRPREDEVGERRIVIHKLCESAKNEGFKQRSLRNIRTSSSNRRNRDEGESLDVERVVEIGVGGESDGAKLIGVEAYQKCRH